MIKILILGLITLGTTNIHAACLYDLKGKDTFTSSPVPLMFPNINNQKLSYKILNNSQQITYSAVNSNFKFNNEIPQGSLSLPNSGVVALELNTGVLANELIGKNNDAKGFNILAFDEQNKTTALSITYGNNSAIQNYKKPLLILLVEPINNSNEITYSYLQPYNNNSKQNIGLYLNQSSNQIGLIINKQNLGYVATLNSKIKSITVQANALFSGFEASSIYLNNELNLELVTDKSKFTNTFPTGTKDICGN